MQVITKEEYAQKKDYFVRRIAQGALFIHPTDTVYRISCDATNSAAVKKLRALKKPVGPFAVIAPSKQWIRDTCHVPPDDESLDLLPGKFTILYSVRNQNAIAKEVHGGLPTLGVRIPSSWSQEIAMILNKPLVTTAANLPDQAFMTSLDNLAPEIAKAVDFCFYDGELKGSKITVIDKSMPIAKSSSKKSRV